MTFFRNAIFFFSTAYKWTSHVCIVNGNSMHISLRLSLTITLSSALEYFTCYAQGVCNQQASGVMRISAGVLSHYGCQGCNPNIKQIFQQSQIVTTTSSSAEQNWWSYRQFCLLFCCSTSSPYSEPFTIIVFFISFS